MNHQYFRDLQSETLEKVLGILKKDNGVLGVVLSGSMAKGKNDAYSDIDVDCFLREGAETSGKNLFEEISKMSPVFSKLWLYGKYGLFLFESGIRLDVNFWPNEDISKFYLSDEKILFDPTRVIEKTLKSNPNEVTKHPKWNPEEFEYIDWIGWMFRQVEAWAYRGAMNGDKAFEKYSNAVDSLAQIRKALIEIKLWIYGQQDRLINIDEEFVNILGQSYPHLNKIEIIGCSRILLNEWEKLLVPYCQKRKIKVPVGKIEKLKKILTDLEKVN